LGKKKGRVERSFLQRNGSEKKRKILPKSVPPNWALSATNIKSKKGGPKPRGGGKSRTQRRKERKSPKNRTHVKRKKPSHLTYLTWGEGRQKYRETEITQICKR